MGIVYFFLNLNLIVLRRASRYTAVGILCEKIMRQILLYSVKNKKTPESAIYFQGSVSGIW